MARKIKTFEGREIRGLRMKAYPSVGQQAEMFDMQRRMRRFWNWLVARSNDTARARDAWAARNGAGTRPIRPANDAGEASWTAYKDALKAWRVSARAVLNREKSNAALKYRTLRDYCEQFAEKQPYNLYRHAVDDDEQPPAHLLQAMLKAYDQALAATRRGQSPPQRKKRDQDVLLQSGSGALLRVIEDRGRVKIGEHPKGPQFSGRIDAEVKLPGVTGWIPCSLGKDRGLQPEQYWVEGVSLRQEADGWYASVRQHVESRTVPAGSGVCGIDVGLVHMFAAVGDDGATLLADNTRRGGRRGRLKTPGGYVELIAERQAAGLPVSILSARSARHIREVVRRELFPFVDRYEFVAVEDLPADIGQRGRPHLSFMRTIVAMLIQRYGCKRVIAVDPAGTSRTCSMCGEIQSRSWSDLPGRIGKCASCGHVENTDLNAARNVLRKLPESLAAQ